MSIVILGITVVPLLFVFLDGFRTTGDINANSTDAAEPVGVVELRHHSQQRVVLGVPRE